MFKLKSIYIKIKRNYVEVTDLNTGETVSKQAILNLFQLSSHWKN